MLTVGMLREAMRALPDDAAVQVTAEVGEGGRECVFYADSARVVGDPSYGFVSIEGSGELACSEAAGRTRRSAWHDPLGDPLEAARARAGRLGVCPIPLLDGFHRGHWDRDSLCSAFGCATCVATPEDLGLACDGTADDAGPAAQDGCEDIDGLVLPF